MGLRVVLASSFGVPTDDWKYPQCNGKQVSPKGPYCAYDVVRLGRSTESSHAVTRAWERACFCRVSLVKGKLGKVKVVKFTK